MRYLVIVVLLAFAFFFVGHFGMTGQAVSEARFNTEETYQKEMKDPFEKIIEGKSQKIKNVDLNGLNVYNKERKMNPNVPTVSLIFVDGQEVERVEYPNGRVEEYNLETGVLTIKHS